MNVFIEKEFIENFEIGFSDNKYSEPFRLLYTVFTEYTNIKCYSDIDDDSYKDAIFNSEILTKLTDLNPSFIHVLDFKETILKEWSDQTLVFTAQERDWFEELKDLPILFFSYDDFEEKLTNFINKTHKRFDLSDEESKFNWNYFTFISSYCSILIFSDPYILSDTGSQKIKDNLFQLLNQNIRKDESYKIFILTEFKNDDVNKKLQILNRDLGGYAVKIYLINRIHFIENIDFHDRLLYSNYTITESPSGFNLKRNKPVNSDVTTTSIFNEYTYKKYINHIKGLKKYRQILEQFTDYNNTTKVIPSNTFDEFDKLNLV